MLQIQKLILGLCFFPMALLSQTVTASKPKKNQKYIIQALPIEAVSSGCGSFLGLKHDVNTPKIEYIFATSTDQNGMVVKINGRVYYFQTGGSGIAGSGEVGGRFTGSWKNKAVSIDLSALVTDSSYESVSFEGEMRIKFKGVIRVLKVVGSEGC